jgi:hypothetical protein
VSDSVTHVLSVHNTEGRRSGFIYKLVPGEMTMLWFFYMGHMASDGNHSVTKVLYRKELRNPQKPQSGYMVSSRDSNRAPSIALPLRPPAR